MIVDVKELPKGISAIFTRGNLYMNKASGEIFFAVCMAGYKILVNVRNGNVWSMEYPFGVGGGYNWIDVTDQYKLTNI